MKLTQAFILSAFMSLSMAAAAQGTQKNVLFIGNSYTDVNNLPSIVQHIAEDMGDQMTYQSNTPGGCTFAQHCTNNSMTFIQQGGWDVVVLQEQSQLPSFPPNQVSSECFPYAARLVDSVYAHGDCTEPMFYMTWGRKDGDQHNAPYYPPLATYEGMDSLLYHRYIYMAEANDASVCPVGRVWRMLRENHAEIELYSGDGSHPSEAGSYAAAVAFYTMIYQRSPEEIRYTYTLDEATSETIKRVVKAVVYDSLNRWKRPLPNAGFTYQENSNHIVFSNLSEEADSYLWEFGDGASSTETNPTHSYTETGNYTVKLIATRHCMSDTTTNQITVTHSGEDVGIETTDNPHPDISYTETHVTVSGNYPFEILDIGGRTLAQGRDTIHIGDLPKGLYIVRIYAQDIPITVKITK